MLEKEELHGRDTMTVEVTGCNLHVTFNYGTSLSFQTFGFLTHSLFSFVRSILKSWKYYNLSNQSGVSGWALEDCHQVII